MGLISSSAVLDLLLLLLFLISMAHCEQPGVLYNNRSLIINGQKKILISGSIHYPRSTPNMWPDLIAKAKAGGLNVIDTYVFWNGHEPEEGKYNFEERYDLVKFIKLVKNASLYVNLRIGPYVCAEWNFGGFPVWLKFVPGISFRTNNEPFKSAMEKFTKKIVKMMKDESLFESQGGPIILSQIENEYGPLEGELGDAGKLYTKWAAEMALSLETRVPWIMCKQEDAPFPIIDTCNGFYCDLFKPNDTRKPKMWTEVWTGWFTAFGGGVPSRPAEDLAFAVALFIANGGSFLNYYMYHGGTNFGRTAGGPFIATSYDYDAPLDEYGLLRQPKWGHLKNLHAAIKQSEPALLSGDPIITNLGIKGDHQQAYVYGSGKKKCAAFLKNYNQHSAVNVTFWNKQYTLPPWSVSILPDCKKVVYNTAEVASKEYYSESEKPRMKRVEGGFEWESYSEAVGSTNDSCSFTAKGLLDQLNTTWDKTDYLWYMIRVNIGSGKGHYNIGNNSTLRVLSAGDALYAYVNGMLLGTAYGSIDHAKFDYSAQVPSLRDGVNEISLLSVAVGLQNIGKFFETWPLGINHVSLGGKNLRMLNWTYKVGMEGEHQWIYSENGSNSVPWVKGDQLANKKPLTWYKTWFNEPSGDEPLALDMDTMSKGQIWVNGNNIGRYWISNKATGKCTGSCNYAGLYREDKCLSRCGKASQHMYQVPRYWLKSNGNFLVVFEEWGGDPHGIKLVKRVVGSV